MMKSQPVIIRPAFPDELARARTLLNGHPVPQTVEFLVAVKEHPVERLVGAIPWWRVPRGDTENSAALRFHLSLSTSIAEESLLEVLHQLEEHARKNQLCAILTDFSLPKDDPLFLQLTARGYDIVQTDRYFSMPGDPGNQRTKKLYQRAKRKIPARWKIESIRGHSPEKIYALVGQQNLMTLQQFQSFWNTASPEHFEENYSCVVVDGEQLIGAFLVTERGVRELHIHVDVVSPERKVHSGLITIAMRNFTSCACPDGFPEVYTSRADSQKHTEGGNTPLRNGGTEQTPRHFLGRILTEKYPDICGMSQTGCPDMKLKHQ